MTKKIKLPGSNRHFIHAGNDEEARQLQTLIHARHAFCIAYMQEQGWGDDVRALNAEQILEIRQHPGWRKPLDGQN